VKLTILKKKKTRNGGYKEAVEGRGNKGGTGGLPRTNKKHCPGRCERLTITYASGKNSKSLVGDERKRGGLSRGKQGAPGKALGRIYRQDEINEP